MGSKKVLNKPKRRWMARIYTSFKISNYPKDKGLDRIKCSRLGPDYNHYAEQIWYFANDYGEGIEVVAYTRARAIRKLKTFGKKDLKRTISTKRKEISHLNKLLKLLEE